MRIVINRGAVDLALMEFGCKAEETCTTAVTRCDYCRERAERALKTALGEVFPKAEIEVQR